MLIAHLPSGYVLGRALKLRGPLLAATVFGAIAPDLDMFWFYLIDDGRVHHHRYWTHIPAVWALIGIAALALPKRFRQLAFAFLAGVALHIVLDSLAGDIMWAWPFSDKLYSLVEVTARHDHWIKNFVLHWVFIVELTIVLTALVLLFTRRKRKRPVDS